MTELTYRDTLVVDQCWCGIWHAIPRQLKAEQKRQHTNGERQTDIYCPLGHSYQIAGKGEAQILREKLEKAETQRDYWKAEQERTEVRRRAAQGQVTKTKNRARGGLCPTPECKRSFADVARHVRSKHPALVGGAE